MTDELEQYKKLCGELFDTLVFYANPETYHAIDFLYDPPAGDFVDDFGKQKEHEHPDYDRAMPGKKARKVLKRIIKKYGDLELFSRIDLWDDENV